MQNAKQNAKITNLKNSNPKAIKISAYYSNGIAGLTFQPKKEGTAKISFRYAGRTYSRKVTVKHWESPCQQFKVGSLNFTKYFKKSEWFNYENRKKDVTGTISIKPKKGWKVL